LTHAERMFSRVPKLFLEVSRFIKNICNRRFLTKQEQTGSFGADLVPGQTSAQTTLIKCRTSLKWKGLKCNHGRGALL
jgi:hypothetical protein